LPVYEISWSGEYITIFIICQSNLHIMHAGTLALGILPEKGS
jgi:hypothetical protein